jgi:outer membrane protein OmpA-like peptidoglycan-associated protein
MLDTIRQQTASYRRGLVLGLTMAEIMVLLVFCLLIAVGVALSSERARLDDTVARMHRLEAAGAADHMVVDTLRRNAKLAEVLDRANAGASAQDIDEFWRSLVESNDVVTKMEREGIPLAALERDANTADKLRQLMRDGVDPDKIARGTAVASAVDAAAAAHNMVKLTPQEIAALVEKSLAPQKTDDSHKGHNWPPIINLSEADGYFFAVGSAELTSSFAMELQGAVTDRLLQIADAYDVDVIEVIGHTDEQPVASHVSNLDRRLASVTSGESDAASLQWADNAGLGLARALSVVKLLSADPRLHNFRILPLSAAQLIGIDGRLTRWDGRGDVRERRRIEIRMRKSV